MWEESGSQGAQNSQRREKGKCLVGAGGTVDTGRRTDKNSLRKEKDGGANR